MNTPKNPTVREDAERHQFTASSVRGGDTDDTTGHSFSGRVADAESVETDDTQGHSASGRVVDAEADETDSAAGHMMRGADAEKDETDDTEGHTLGGVFADWETMKAAETEAPGFHIGG